MKIFITTVFLTFTIIDAIDFNFSQLVAKIIGGSIAEPEQFTYNVMLKHFNGRFLCGGCLISDIHVLTAAHPFKIVIGIKSPKYGGVYVVVGTTNRHRGGDNHTIKHIDINNEYMPNQPLSVGDIALVTLHKNVIMSPHVSIIALPESEIHIIKKAIVTGWGAVHPVKEHENPEVSDELKVLSVYIINNHLCQMIYKYHIIHCNQFCATSGNKIENVSVGDAGSPIVHENQVIGIVSGGVGHLPSIPAIYANVYNYLDYIEDAKVRAAAAD